MHSLTPAEAFGIVETAFWRDGPFCPRCSGGPRFVRVKSRDGRWHRCLGCYVCVSATSRTFLHKIRTPLPTVISLFLGFESVRPRTVTALAKQLGLDYMTALSLRRLWRTNRDTLDGRRLHASMLAAFPDEVAPLLHPDNPLHGLL